MNTRVAGRYRRWLVACLLVVWAGLGATGVATKATPEPPVTTPGTPGIAESGFGPVQGEVSYRIALLNPFPEHAFWQAIQTAVETRADEDAVAVDVFALEAPSAPAQVAQMEAVIANGFDGVILGAVDPVGIVPGVVAANEAGVPVVALDTAPAGGQTVSLVGIDNIAASAAAGEFIAEAIRGEGEVLNLQGDMASSVAQERDLGVRSAWDRSEGIAEGSVNARWDRSLAAGIVRGILPAAESATPVADPGLRAIFAATDEMALGAVEAVGEAGSQGIVIVGFGGEPEALEAVASGALTATVAQLPSRIGMIAVDVIVRHLNGDPVPPWVDPGFVVVTKDNVEWFVANVASPAYSALDVATPPATPEHGDDM